MHFRTISVALFASIAISAPAAAEPSARAKELAQEILLRSPGHPFDEGLARGTIERLYTEQYGPSATPARKVFIEAAVQAQRDVADESAAATLDGYLTHFDEAELEYFAGLTKDPRIMEFIAHRREVQAMETEADLHALMARTGWTTADLDYLMEKLSDPRFEAVSNKAQLVVASAGEQIGPSYGKRFAVRLKEQCAKAKQPIRPWCVR